MSYFPPGYFGATVPLTNPQETPDPGPLTDAQALAWVESTLTGLGIFGWVGVGAVAAAKLSTDQNPSAWIWPVSFSERDQGDSTVVLRTLRYAVGLAITTDASEAGLVTVAKLDKLSNAVADVLSGDGPAGSLEALSRVTTGAYDQPWGSKAQAIDGTGVHASAHLLISAEIAYLVNGRAGRPS